MATHNGTLPANGGIPELNMLSHHMSMRTLAQFASGSGIIDYNTVSRAGTGTGTITRLDTITQAAKGSTVVETWTVTFTAATTFDVSGSVSGAQAGGTVGVDYSVADLIRFQIDAGGTPHVVSDTFTFDVIANSNVAVNDIWVLDRYDPGSDDPELLAHGIGLAGTDTIYGGMRTASTTSPDRWAIQVIGNTGYNSGEADWTLQPGTSGEKYVTMGTVASQFWFICNGRRFAAVFSGNTLNAMQSLYLGWFNTYATPDEYPYPFYLGAGTNTFRTPEDANSAAIADPNGHSRTRAPDGSWYDMDNSSTSDVTTPRKVWPQMSEGLSRSWLLELRQLDDKPILLPCTIQNYEAGTEHLFFEVFGVLDGFFGVPGLSLAPTDILNDGSTDYIVGRGAGQSSDDDYWAMKLE